jgi:predicted  nucleic acid-binding Zn-ribbon protein
MSQGIVQDWYLHDLVLNNMKVSAQNLRESIVESAQYLRTLEKEIKDMEQISGRLRQSVLLPVQEIRGARQAIAQRRSGGREYVFASARH